MTLHVFANIVTSYGTAGNNRGETEGNTTTLQKLIWQGQPHTTVSAEAIRFALRRLLADKEEAGTNRTWNEVTRKNDWQDAEFKDWGADSAGFIDDDLLGFMSAEAAKEENTKGSANVRRAVLEMTRAVSLTPWTGDVVFNAASPRATASAAKGDGDNPVPYMAEIHATRYQYGLAMTPAALQKPSRAAKALEAVGELGTVAGNHARFLFDFAPDAIVIRLTNDPAPRLLYCFEPAEGGKTVRVSPLTKKMEAGDIRPDELIVGVSDLNAPLVDSLRIAGVTEIHGVRNAVELAARRINEHSGVKG
ncbi:type I-B CRISPR-associated protein Cas7/Cst2/DevR [Thalassoroseus pseudoceratinae]|uniref:type I-B CRISPR-associated protein Cas7/Cst2/DevR n=1 Tax=Thalassoroseus pseudoceratinae TaxID=2713176 RepID=UPI001423A624|nr:type I-B CRISPR-associated protein Cas7/Cst2/DevR [Thalassoroseus pseudoceratinae]